MIILPHLDFEWNEEIDWEWLGKWWIVDGKFKTERFSDWSLEKWYENLSTDEYKDHHSKYLLLLQVAHALGYIEIQR